MVLPVVFMLLLGIVWFGRAFNIYSTIQQAAQQGAITAARNSCATCGNRLANLDPAVDGAITAVMKASNLDPGQIQTGPNPNLIPCVVPPGLACTATTSNIYVCQNVQLNPASAGGTQPPQTPQCGAVVSFQYPFQFYLPGTSLNLSQVILSAQAQSRMEN
jgi:TadE-like protein